MCTWTDRKSYHPTAIREERGVALITALGMLVLFSMLGSAYLGYMLNEREATRLELTWVHGRQGAEAGVYSAIGALERQLSGGNALPANAYELTIPAYRADGSTLSLRDDLSTTATVTVSDENARININMAPRGVLEQILGVDRATARAITSDLPRSGEAGSSRFGWFTSVDELVTRGYMTQEAFDALNKDLLTVYTGDDVANPEHYINLSTAPAEVVAAVLNIPLERAQNIAQGGPLLTLPELASRAGQDPSAFNLIPDPGASPDALPKELVTESRTFRIVCEARVASRGGGARVTPESRVEAVVHFPVDGSPVIRYWSVGRPDDSEPAPEVAEVASPPEPERAEEPAPAVPEPEPVPEGEAVPADAAQV